MFDYQAFKDTALTTTPFPFIVVPRFLTSENCRRVNEDFPQIKGEGSFPLNELKYGPVFQQLVDSLQGEELRLKMAEKFQINLDNRPTIVTVRGKSNTRDGHIHTDTDYKIITALLYMNPAWENSGGRLRLLRSPDNIDDYIMEVPPVEGTLLAFAVSPNSWHGHLPFIGDRRVIQLNWVKDQSVVERELSRHKFSAKVKKLKSWVGLN